MKDTQRYYEPDGADPEPFEVDLHTLGPTQVSILTSLDANGKQTSAEIAEKLDKTQNAVRAAIQRFENDDIFNTSRKTNNPVKTVYEIDDNALLPDKSTAQTLST